MIDCDQTGLDNCCTVEHQLIRPRLSRYITMLIDVQIELPNLAVLK